MSAFLAALLIAFVAILLVELPDKTLVATLVLSTRYPRRLVLIGVAAAFAIQCLIAVAAGGLLHLLPRRPLEAIVAMLFGVGAFLLIRESFSRGPDASELDAHTPAEPLAPRRVVALVFGVLFAAEWGDASQLATAGLVARYGEPVAVGVGAFAALLSVAVGAVVLGRVIVRRVPLAWVHRAAGALFTVFALIAALAAIHG